MKEMLHRWIWQSIPRSYRRAALFKATSVVASRSSRGEKPAKPIIVAGGLRAASGLGVSAQLCYNALKRSGVRVYGVDLTSVLMQPLDNASFAFAEGAELEGPGTILLHVNSPLVPLALWRLGRRFMRGKYVVGYWHWELSQCPADWRHGIAFVHEIWVPSAFTAAAVREIAGDRPVRVVPHPVALRGPAVGARVPRSDRPFTATLIFNMASSFARKNPLAVIAAFRQAFGDDVSARLIVKTSNGESFSTGISWIKQAIGAAHNIVLLDQTMSAHEIETLYRESDVVMSLHRSEGFGLTLAEAMLRGLPVIATNWSGSVDFVTSDTGFPIPYRLVPAADPQGTYHHPDMMWADADYEAAAEALRGLRSDPKLARSMGEAGAAYAARAWTAQGYAESVCQHLGL